MEDAHARALRPDRTTLGDYARARLAERRAGCRLQVTGAGSLFKVTATDAQIRDYRDAATTDKRWEATCSLALLNEGFVLHADDVRLHLATSPRASTSTRCVRVPGVIGA
jgi:glutamate-1-semialdehyde aminotransferase